MRPGLRRAELVVRGEFTDLGSFDALVHRHERQRVVEIGWASPTLPGAVGRGPLSRGLSSPADVSLRFGRHVSAAEIRYDGAGLTVGPVRVDFSRVTLTREERRSFDEQAGRPMTSPEDELLVSESGAVADLLEYAVSSDEEIATELRAATDQAPEDLIAEVRRIDMRILVESAGGLPWHVIGARTVNGGLLPRQMVRASQQELFESHGPLQVALQLLDGIVLSSGRSARRSIGSLNYLGPMRQAPERLHILTGEIVRGAGVRGQHVVDLLARRPHLRTDVNTWFKRLEIPYEIDVRSVTDRAVAGAIGEVHCLLLKDSRSGVEVAPTDVGFGIGQVLPVIVQSVLTRNQTLCIEQPEIHLHPALQAELAEMFAATAGRSGQQFILETHSEHLILRLQRLVRRGDLDSKMLSILHVGTRYDGESHITHLGLDANGDFVDEWPEGFFEERSAELFED